MTKHRRTKRRSQKGGFSLNPMNWFGSSEPADPNAPKKSFGETISDWGSSLNTKIGSVATDVSETTKTGLTNMVEGVSSLVPGSSQGTSSSQGITTDVSVSTNANPNMDVNANQMNNTTGVVSTGGRRRRRARSMKGGKGGSNLAYYAAPVSGLKVAEPTSWQYYANGVNQYSVKGGSRKRKGRKSRRTRRHKKR